MVFDISAYKNIYNKYEGEGNMEALILVLFLLIMILLGLEAYQVKRDRALLQHVVYVNGIRGKSTVTRMIAAGLKSGGLSLIHIFQMQRLLLLLHEAYQRPCAHPMRAGAPGPTARGRLFARELGRSLRWEKAVKNPVDKFCRMQYNISQLCSRPRCGARPH